MASLSTYNVFNATLTFNLTHVENPAVDTAMDNTTQVDISQLLFRAMGPPRREMDLLILLTIIYSIIFISGTVGNICTCIVIARTHSMHTTTNFYLFSLALSDLLLICFGLPTELYTIWEMYPWRLGVVFCYLRQTCLEVTSYASVLTITAFTVERYVAICRPLLAYKMATLSRAVKIIIGIWLVSFLAALPYTIHTRTYYKVSIPNTSIPVPDSYVCSIPDEYLTGFMYYMFQISTFLFFFIPITIIIILYILIGLALRRSSAIQNGFDDRKRLGSNASTHGKSTVPNSSASGQQPRKVVIRMLVAVTIAFIICWAPFHSQRLMVLYVKDWTPALHTVQTHIFDVSGVLYFVSSTVNPILYSLISKRYRIAFKKTILPCLKSKHATNQTLMSQLRFTNGYTASIRSPPKTNHNNSYTNHHNHNNHHQHQQQQQQQQQKKTLLHTNGSDDKHNSSNMSQAMVMLKNDSTTSLKLIFRLTRRMDFSIRQRCRFCRLQRHHQWMEKSIRKDQTQHTPCYETIPLTPSGPNQNDVNGSFED